jgi:hypothetical protein
MRLRRPALVTAVIFSLLLAASPAAAQRKGPAAKAFARGESLYEQTDYVGAIKAFKRAHRLHPHYLITCNIARCYERLSDMVEAAQHYRRCLAEGGGASRQARAIRKAMRSVEAQIARITITSPDRTATIYIDGKEVGGTPLRIPLNPGPHQMKARRKGTKTTMMTIEADIGEKRTIRLEPARSGGTAGRDPPQKDPTKEEEQDQDQDQDQDQEAVGGGAGAGRDDGKRGIHQAWFWTLAAVTFALTFVTAVAGVMTLQANDDYNADPTEEGYDKVLHRKLLTNIFLGATLGAAATSAMLFFYTDFSGSRSDAADLASRGGQAAVTLGLGIRGTF